MTGAWKAVRVGATEGRGRLAGQAAPGRRAAPGCLAAPVWLRASVCLAVLAAALAGCGPHAPVSPPTAPDAARADPDFLAPPAVTGGDRDPAGGVRLIGRSQPGALVTLAAPDGAHAEVTADDQGAWTLVLGPDPQPRVFALSADPPAARGRRVRAEGALAVLPAPEPPLVLMRGGAAAWPIAEPGAGLRWMTVDYDAGGGAAVAGFAPPGAPVRLMVDGVASGAGQADPSGRFGFLWLGAPLAAGPHAFVLATPGASQRLALRTAPAAPMAGAPARISRDPLGWRIDWTPPGGGVQTTLVLAPSAVSAAPGAAPAR